MGLVCSSEPNQDANKQSSPIGSKRKSEAGLKERYQRSLVRYGEAHDSTEMDMASCLPSPGTPIRKLFSYHRSNSTSTKSSPNKTTQLNSNPCSIVENCHHQHPQLVSNSDVHRSNIYPKEDCQMHALLLRGGKSKPEYQTMDHCKLCGSYSASSAGSRGYGNADGNCGYGSSGICDCSGNSSDVMCDGSDSANRGCVRGRPSDIQAAGGWEKEICSNKFRRPTRFVWNSTSQRMRKDEQKGKKLLYRPQLI